MAYITMPNSAFQAIALDTNNPLFKLANYVTMVIGTYEPKGDHFVSPKLTDYKLFDVQTAMAVVQATGEVHEYPAWIAIPEENINTEVPLYVPEHIDSDQLPRTWVNWRDETHFHKEIGGIWYVESASFGVDLLGSVLLQLAADGYDIISLPEYQEILPAGEPE